MTDAEFRLEKLRRPVRKIAHRFSHLPSAHACGVTADDLEQIGLLAAWAEIGNGESDRYLVKAAKHEMLKALNRPDRRMTYDNKLEVIAGAPDRAHARAEAALSLAWLERAFRRHTKARANSRGRPRTAHARVRRELMRQFLRGEVESCSEFTGAGPRFGLTERAARYGVAGVRKIYVELCEGAGPAVAENR